MAAKKKQQAHGGRKRLGPAESPGARPRRSTHGADVGPGFEGPGRAGRPSEEAAELAKLEIQGGSHRRDSVIRLWNFLRD